MSRKQPQQYGWAVLPITPLSLNVTLTTINFLNHRPGAPVNTQYVYDTKFKQNAYGALLDEYLALFGPHDGRQLAVGESGPLDEAYVGGGS
jgi:hypothetical protein